MAGHPDRFICHSDRREQSKTPGRSSQLRLKPVIPAGAGTTVAWIAGQLLKPDGNAIAGPPAQVLKLRIFRRLENQPPVNPETL